MPAEPSLQIVLISGPSDCRRATAGFSLAAAAAACGTPVVVFLIMEAVRWLDPGVGSCADVPGFPSVSELIETLRAAGARVEVCSSCTDGACAPGAGRSPGAIPAGLATVALRATECPTVVF
jgi:predicted peroxiredoxin